MKTDIIAEINAAQADADAAAQHAFRQLVRQVADGKQPAPDQARKVLADAGKTTADLQPAVAHLQRRRAMRATYDRGHEATKELQKVEAEIVAARGEIEEAMKRHNEKVGPLLDRRKALEQAKINANSAKNQLVASCDDAQVEAVLREKGEQVRDLMKRIAYWNDIAHNVAFGNKGRALAEMRRHGQDKLDDDEEVEVGVTDWRREADRHQASIDNAKAAAGELQKEMNKLQDEMAGIHLLKLEP